MLYCIFINAYIYISNLNETFKRKKEKNDLTNTLLVEKAKKDLDHAYDKKQKNYVKNKIKEIKDAHINHRSRLVWDTVNEVARRKNPKRGRIKASYTDERLAIWKDHFQKLLGQSPEIDDQPVPKVFDTLPIKTGEFTAIELQASIKSFQNNKATDFDNIPIETWKTGCMNEELLNVCNKKYLGDAPLLVTRCNLACSKKRRLEYSH